MFSPPSSSLGGGLGGDFGSSLLAELDSIGSLFDSFGTGSSAGTSGSSASKPNQTTTSSSVSSYGVTSGSSSGLAKTDQSSKPSMSSYGSASNSSLNKADRTSKPSLSSYDSPSRSPAKTSGYGTNTTKSTQPSRESGYRAGYGSNSTGYGGSYGQPTNPSSPTYSGTNSVSKTSTTSGRYLSDRIGVPVVKNRLSCLLWEFSMGYNMILFFRGLCQ